jgi:hypothetical protein
VKMRLIWFLAVLFLNGCAPALASEIIRFDNEYQADWNMDVTRAVMGEARSCSLYEQEAIARAILNRGNLRGVYGFHAHMEPITEYVYSKAETAVDLAYKRDITNGATSWLSFSDLRRCKNIGWRKNMKVTLTTKHFVFYSKEVAHAHLA